MIRHGKGITALLFIALSLCACGQPLQVNSSSAPTLEPAAASAPRAEQPTADSVAADAPTPNDLDSRIKPVVDTKDPEISGVAEPQPDDACIVKIPEGATWVEPSEKNHYCFMSQQADVNGHVVEQTASNKEPGGDFAWDTSSPEKIQGNYVQSNDGEHPVYARDTKDGLAHAGDTCYWIGEKPGIYTIIVNTTSVKLEILPSPEGGYPINDGTLPLKIDSDKVQILQINQVLVASEDQTQKFVPGTRGAKYGFALLVLGGQRDGQNVFDRVANFTYEDIRDGSGALGSDGQLDTLKFMFHEGVRIIKDK